MRLLVIIFALLGCSICASGQAPAVRGHRIGETFLDFVKVENAAPKLTECIDLLADPRIEKRSQKDFLAKVRFDNCVQITNVSRTGNGEIGAGQIGMSIPGSVLFYDGKLVKMELDFWNLPPGSGRYSFDSVLRDFSEKFGAATRAWADEFQNGFGARVSYRRTAWVTKDLLVSLNELQSDSSTAVIEDRIHAEKTTRESEASHKSILDR